MTDKAQTDLPTSFSASLAVHARNAALGVRPLEKVVSLSSRNSDAPLPVSPEREGSPAAPDWSSAIELVREATEAIRISEERASDLEEQLDQMSEQAAEQLRQLNAEILASDQKLAQTEERLRLAEARADEAESWLRRLHDAVHSGFAQLPRRQQQAGDGRTRESAFD